MPTKHLRVAWRGGIDLHPLPVDDPEAMRWLRTLIWPEQVDRQSRLDAAIEIARQQPPRLTPGDLIDLLESQIAEAAKYGLVIVFHSAVISYLARARRQEFVRLMGRLVGEGACRWVSNEDARVLPEISRPAAHGLPQERYVLGIDGNAVAWTQWHGSSITWL